jgi:predicted Zn-dependent protease with MMP-like domain
MPVEMGPAEFDALVDRALDGIPDEIASLVRNVAVLVGTSRRPTTRTSWGCTTESRSPSAGATP